MPIASSFQPAGDQPQAIEKLIAGIEAGLAALVALENSRSPEALQGALLKLVAWLN